MTMIRSARGGLLAGLIVFSCTAVPIVSAQVASRLPVPALGGTSWQLVQFEGGDGTRLTPDDRTKYTIAFGNDGRVTVRIDCNRGGGTWRSAGAGQLAFGPLALTKVFCPPGSLHDQIVRQWPYVRTYMIRNGHLYLSLMADGGIYEFEPLGSAARRSASVRGTASYRERVVLPVNAVLEVSLEDISRTRGPTALVARVRNEQPGNPPIPFLIAYDPAQIIPNRSYTVRARILVADRVWFATDQNYPVLTGGRGSDVQLILRRVNLTGPGNRLPTSSPAPLEGTYWRLTSVGNTTVAATSRQREPHLILRSRDRAVSGNGGCNSMGGTYELRGDRITFSRVSSTMMACAGGMNTEQAFFAALGRTNRWRVSGDMLELLDSAGNVLARFEAVY